MKLVFLLTLAQIVQVEYNILVTSRRKGDFLIVPGHSLRLQPPKKKE
jgi:hypothetical protein